GDHPGEHSLLVLGITPDDAVALAREFAQDAILGIGADATPRLLVTRPEATPSGDAERTLPHEPEQNVGCC
ncbi:MAG: DUF3293 domain-containing protein, partial [Rhodanobacteraceae bacterium]